MQFLCRSHGWTVVNHYYTQNWGLTVRVFCGNAALTVCAPHCGHYAPKLARSWPCSFCRSHDWTVVNHYYTQNWGLTVCFLRQCCTHSLCRTLWPLCPKTGSVLAMPFLCRSHDWTVVNHYYTQNCGKSLLHTKLGSHHVFFAAMLHSLFVPHIVATMLQNWLGLGHAAFVQKS